MEPAKSNTENGTDYEKFVQSIYSALIKEDGFYNIIVEHNKTDLIGNSGCAHQIDVYWEFEVAGTKYKTAIECKAFSSNVSIGRIRDFYGVLADVPNLNGIFVTLIGFQSGAKKYAEHYGIMLKEIREPTEADWKGRIKDIHLGFIIVDKEIRSIKPAAKAGYTGPLKSTFEGLNYDSFIVDSAGNKIASYEDVRRSLSTDYQSETGRTERKNYKDAYLLAKSGPIPISHIDITYDVIVEYENIEIYGEKIAKAIVRDVKSGEMRFVNCD